VHFVSLLSRSANRQTGVPHFDSKYEVEKHIAKIGVRATILAPVAFVENHHFVKEQLVKGICASVLPPTRALAQVAVADIGAVAVRVLEDASLFAGERPLKDLPIMEAGIAYSVENQSHAIPLFVDCVKQLLKESTNQRQSRRKGHSSSDE
jgi:hypothetical protein